MHYQLQDMLTCVISRINKQMNVVTVTPTTLLITTALPELQCEND